ncbi:MAG: hypothetical protein PWP40_1251 [Rhodocyclaceae bacterium]|nr:hypothetical protein [Rhodocyclaceae bacterium]
MSRAICKQTAQKMELRRAVQSCAVLGEQPHFQQWRGMQARQYPKWYCAEPFLRGALRSLQGIDLKEKNELRNCAPLKGEKKAAQYGFSFPELGASRAATAKD